jgi:hypothetical protein
MSTEIQDHLRYWQERLRVQDWDVTLRVLRYHEMGEGLLGQCFRNDASRTAEIRLLALEDVSGSVTPPGRDLEVTLVHELLHVLFHGASDETENRIAFEQAIDATARALVELDRGASVLLEGE